MREKFWTLAGMLALLVFLWFLGTCFDGFAPVSASRADQEAEEAGAEELVRVQFLSDREGVTYIRESRSIERSESESALLSSIEESVRFSESESASIEESIRESVRIAESEAESIHAAESEAARLAEEARLRAEAEARARAEAEARARAEAEAKVPLGNSFVFIGDSRTSDFYHYGYLPKNQCYYVGGAVLSWYGIVAEAAAHRPGKAVFLGGQNDLGVYRGNPDAFVQEYSKLIRTFLASSPETIIYVAEILPDQPQAIQEIPARARIPEFNAAIRAMCAANGWICIDTSAGISPAYYGPDGIHFTYSWYPIWLNNLRTLAGL